VVSIIRDTIDAHPALLVSPYGHFFAWYDLIGKQWISRTDSSKKIISTLNLKDNLIRKIFKARNGDIYFATAKYGIGLWPNKSKPLSYLSNDPENKRSISNDNVFDMAEDVKGNLWVSTYGGGLNYFNIDTRSFTHAASTNNLTEGIQTDKKGNVWMISNGNLQKYEPGLETSTSFVLPDIEKSGGVRGNIYKDKDGIMYVAVQITLYTLIRMPQQTYKINQKYS
jgi:ligand-binding sensor domain-containing protein